MEIVPIRLPQDMYSMTVNVNPDAMELLELVNLDIEFILKECRFRDAYLSKDRTSVILYTRLGGGNQDYYKDSIEELRSHKNYIKDYDDEFDSTFASFEFKIDSNELPKVAAYFANSDTTTGADKTKASIEWMEKDPEGFIKAHQEFDKAMKDLYKKMGIL